MGVSSAQPYRRLLLRTPLSFARTPVPTTAAHPVHAVGEDRCPDISNGVNIVCRSFLSRRLAMPVLDEQQRVHAFFVRLRGLLLGY